MVRGPQVFSVVEYEELSQPPACLSQTTIGTDDHWLCSVYPHSAMPPLSQDPSKDPYFLCISNTAQAKQQLTLFTPSFLHPGHQFKGSGEQARLSGVPLREHMLYLFVGRFLFLVLSFYYPSFNPDHPREAQQEEAMRKLRRGQAPAWQVAGLGSGWAQGQYRLTQ